MHLMAIVIEPWKMAAVVCGLRRRCEALFLRFYDVLLRATTAFSTL
jgi:hypothetical protein